MIRRNAFIKEDPRKCKVCGRISEKLFGLFSAYACKECFEMKQRKVEEKKDE